MKFTNILFPVDFSERCKTVAPFVQAAVERDGARLTLVCFVDASVMWYGTADAPCMPELNISGMVEETRESLLQFEREYFPGMKTERVVEEGDPGACIVEMARESKIDLIMMPTRGHGLFRRALLGSVTAKVLHDAECAVWTAAHTDELGFSGSPAEQREWRNVLCAIDTTADALRLIRRAADIASDYGSAVYLVHAVPLLTESRPEKYYNREFEVFLKESAREVIGKMQKEAETNFGVCIEAGNISSVVAGAAQAHHADLVVTGRGALHHFGGRLRTHVYSIIRDVPCPVLSI